MRFCTFRYQDDVSFGCDVGGERVLDLQRAPAHLAAEPGESVVIAAGMGRPGLRNWLEWDGPRLEATRELAAQADAPRVQPAVRRLDEITLLAPIPDPGKIIAIGLNYKDHAEEQGAPLPERPLIFAKFPTSIIGPGEPLRLPPVSSRVDPEAELCIVMLDRGREWEADTVRPRVAYMCGNDVSARDLQYSDKQWVRAKSLDSFAPCGPWLVTADEVGDPHDLAIECRVNGEVRQSSSTSQLIFDTEALVTHISEAITLEPGDIIFTGTPSGVGVFRDPPVFLEAGDVVEVEIEKLGVLRNPVV